MASNVTWAQVHVVLCEQHQQELDMHCEDCHLDLCLECAKMDHTKHNWSSIKNIARKIRKKCRIGLKKVHNTDLVALEEDLYKLQCTEKRNTELFNREKEKVELQFDKIVDSLSEIKNRILTCVEDKKDINNQYLKQTRKSLEDKSQKAKEIISFIEKNKVSDPSLVEHYNQVQDLLQRENIYFHENEYSMRYFGEESDTECLDRMMGRIIDVNVFEIEQISNFSVKNTQIDSIHTFKENIAWISKETQCLKVDRTGNVERTVLLECQIGDFTVCSNDTIYYTDMDQRCVVFVSSAGEKQTVFDAHPLIPLGICWSTVGGLLVTLCEDDDAYEPHSSCSRLLKSITLTGKGIKEIEFDEKNNRLFTFPTRVAQNKNTDICVIDMKDTDTGELYILSSDGIRRAIYRGTETDQNPFCPCAVECDSDYNCIVSDTFNSSLHVLHCTGQLLKILRLPDLQELSSVSIIKHTMWIGTSGGDVGVYRYIKDHDDAETIPV